jgi:hypothetical protein
MTARSIRAADQDKIVPTGVNRVVDRWFWGEDMDPREEKIRGMPGGAPEKNER